MEEKTKQRQFGINKKVLIGISILVIMLLAIIIFPSKKPAQEYLWTRNAANSQSDNIGKAKNTLTPEEITNILHSVCDPELKVDIVDLGLIYQVLVNNNAVNITMTLTAPTCPYGVNLIEDVKKSLFSNPDVHNVHLRVVFDPPWTVDRIKPDVRKKIFELKTISA